MSVLLCVVGLPSVKISLTNKVSSDTFGGIMALSGASGKKKKKGKGKKKVSLDLY